MLTSLGLPSVTQWSANSLGTSKHGWCLTNQHDVCIVEITNHICGCECHGTGGK